MHATDDEFKNVIGATIQRERKQVLKITVEELLEKFHQAGLTYFTKHTIHNIEEQRRNVRDFELYLIAKALDYTIQDLYRYNKNFELHMEKVLRVAKREN